MADEFRYDVFLSHSAKDKSLVRPLAERLRSDGVRVWLDDWMLKPGANIPHEIEEGLEQSRVLVLCMSANAFGSDWAHLESSTFRFRDPLNKDRRFIPLRLDDAPIRGSLAQFMSIRWQPEHREEDYPKLLEACRSSAAPSVEAPAPEHESETVLLADYEDVYVDAYAFSPDGRRALTAAEDRTVRLWDLETGRCLRKLEGHGSRVRAVAWSADPRYALSAADDFSLRVWDIKTGKCLRELYDKRSSHNCVAWTADRQFALAGSFTPQVRLWEVETESCTMLEGHERPVHSVAWSPDEGRALSGSLDGSIRIWDIGARRCIRVLERHQGWVLSLAWSADGRRAFSGGGEGTLRLWDVETGACLRVYDGRESVHSIAWSADERYVLSGGGDASVRVWEVESGRCVHVLEGHHASTDVQSVAWSADGRRAFSGDAKGMVWLWNVASAT